MKNVLFIILLLSSCSSINTLSKTDLNKLSEQSELGYGGNCYLKSFELGELPLDVIVDKLSFSKGSRTFYLKGKITTKDSGEILPGSDVIIGKIKNYKEKPWKIVPTAGAITDKKGEFQIKTVIDQGDKLFIGHQSYILKIYDISKLGE